LRIEQQKDSEHRFVTLLAIQPEKEGVMTYIKRFLQSICVVIAGSALLGSVQAAPVSYPE